MIFRQWNDVVANRILVQIEISSTDYEEALDKMTKENRWCFNELGKEQTLTEKLMALQLIAEALEQT